tara:strand:- start:175 stop:627 length:453 start_codon:yes stop_codon:yes gene_type:complete
MIEYREIRSEDFPSLCVLGALMHGESSYSHLKFSKPRLLEIFNLYMSDPNRAVFIAIRDGEPLGLYAGYLSKYYFSDELVANDIAWFVIKERRGSRVGLRLLSCFETWAKDRGASEVRIGYSTDINPVAFDSLMQKRGYSRVGANYRLEN